MHFIISAWVQISKQWCRKCDPTAGLVKESWQRAVEPQDSEPALLRICLDPVAASDTFWLFRPEIDGG